MQDLQVTIEVRFITLNDNFYERIGVNFDFEFGPQPPSNAFAGSVVPGGAVPPTALTLGHADMTVGLSSTNPSTFSTDLEIPFTQNSYAAAIPQFGGFDPTQAATLGFAIMSDIEAYFFITAAQGDRRSNVLQAPKVTLFNGQTAMVSDTSQTPFVMSVIPVVGEFAAAQQPVIVVLNEGTFLTVQAVVSSDRRFVRLTRRPLLQPDRGREHLHIHRYAVNQFRLVQKASRPRPTTTPRAAPRTRRPPQVRPCNCPPSPSSP